MLLLYSKAQTKSIQSGTAEIADNALGNFASDVIYDDTNIKEVESIPDAAFHRNVSLELIAADKAGVLLVFESLCGPRT